MQELLAIVGIAAGVALMFASLVASTSLTGSVQQLMRGIAGESRWQLTARAANGFDASLLDDVLRIDGVRDATPLLEARALVRGPGGEQPVLLVGGDPRLARASGPLLQVLASEQLALQQAVAVPEPVAQAIGVEFGDDVSVTAGGGRNGSSLAVQLDESEIGSLMHSPIALAPLSYAQRLSGLPDRLTRIFVRPEPGADGAVLAGLERLVGDRVNVLDAHADAAAFEQAAVPTNQSTALFCAFAAGIGFLFTLTAMLLTVSSRRNFITVLRMSGKASATLQKVMLLDAIEAAILGVVGSALGLLLGDQLSRRLFDRGPGYLEFAFTTGSQRIIESATIVIPVAAGVCAAAIAVLIAVVDSLTPPRPGPVRRKTSAIQMPLRLAGGSLGCVLLAALVLLASPTAAVGALLILTLALLLVLPLALHGAVAAVMRLGVLGHGAVAMLAVTELLSSGARVRMYALTATGAIAVFASVTIGGAHRDLQRGLDASASQIDANADIWATFPGAPNAFATTPFRVSPTVLDRVRQLDGIARVAPYRGGFLDIGDRRTWVLAPPPDAPAPVPARQIYDGDVATASERLRAGGWVVVSEKIADQLGVAVDDVLELPSPRRIRLRVAALSTNLGWPPGAIIVNADDFARGWGTTAPSALHIAIEPGADADEVASKVAAALAPAPVTIETRLQRERRHFAASREGLERLTHIAALVLGAAIVAIATAITRGFWQRRATLAQLKVQGFSEGELWRSLLLESAILLGTGCLTGAIFGLGGQVCLSRGLQAITGFPVFYSMGIGVAILMLSIVTVSALVILAIPGRLAARVAPAPRIA